MTEEQINDMIKKHNDFMDSMTEEERIKYYESFGLKKVSEGNCEACPAQNICVYKTEVVPKTQKDYFCKDALERYQKMQISEKSEEIDLSGVKYDCSTCSINGTCTNMTSYIPSSHQNWWCETDRKLHQKSTELEEDRPRNRSK